MIALLGNSELFQGGSGASDGSDSIDAFSGEDHQSIWLYRLGCALNRILIGVLAIDGDDLNRQIRLQPEA
jgi:hypothetical protein